MTKQDLHAYITREINLSDARVSVLVKDLRTGAPLLRFDAGRQIPAASLIKTPIMLTALDMARCGMLFLDDAVPVRRADILEDSQAFERGERSCTIRELINWMIIASDNTAGNVLIRLLTPRRVNAFCASAGLRDTALNRSFQDHAAVREGRENYTSADDQLRLFEGLHQKSLLTPELCETALSILRRQRWNDQALRYIADDVAAAHKTGSTGAVKHDAGILYPSLGAAYFFAFCVTEDAREGGKPLIGRMSRAVYDYFCAADRRVPL